MKFGKKLLAVVLAGVLALAMLTACGGGSGSAKVNVDLSKSREILGAFDDIRTEGKKDNLILAEEASLMMGNWAKARAAWNANYRDEAITKKETDEMLAAKTAIREMTIDGKKCVNDLSFGLQGADVDKAKEQLESYYKKYLVDDAYHYNYVAIATYDDGKEAATVVILLEMK